MNISAGNNPQMSQIIAKSWSDAAFRARLLADPMKTLTDEGVSIPAGLEIRACENTDNVFNLVIPARPQMRHDDSVPSSNAPTACCKPVGWPNHKEMNW